MRGNGSLGYRSCKTSHYSSCCCNSDRRYDDKIIEASLDDGRRGNRSLETSQSSSLNRGGYHSSDNGKCGSMSQDTGEYYSCNCGVYHFGVDGRGGTRYQYTSHSSSHNVVSRVGVKGRAGYRSQTRQYSLQLSGVHSIF